MSIDKATVTRIAKLARLRVPEDEKEPLARELQSILSWIEQLSEVDTRDVPPLTSVVKTQLPQRADQVNDGGYLAEILANAPKQAAGFYVVPKVIE